jgi:serine/threonine protein kinase
MMASNETDYPRTIEEYEILDFLGEGAYGTVSSAMVKNTEIEVAIKQTKPGVNESVKNYEAELFAYKTFIHPNILKLYTAFYEADVYYLVFELMSDDAHDTFNETDILDCATSMIKAIGYIHSFGFVHLDIKPRNILYKKIDENRKHWVLADMGFICNPKASRCKFGTTYYMPPETFLKKPEQFTFEDYTKVDYWSLGMTLGYMYEGSTGNVVAWAIAITKLINSFEGMDGFLEEFGNIDNGMDQESDTLGDIYGRVMGDENKFIKNIKLVDQKYIDIAWSTVYNPRSKSKISQIAKSLINIDPKERSLPEY